MAQHYTKGQRSKGGKFTNDHAARTRPPLEDACLFGTHAVTAALANPKRRLLSLYATENTLAEVAETAAARDIVPQVLRPPEISRLAPDGAVHQGMLLFAKPLPPVAIEDFDLKGPVLVLDQVTDPHNVGAVIRTAAAFGVSGLITTRLFSPEATGILAKAASGGLEVVPWARETNLARALTSLNDLGVETIGLEGSAEAVLGPANKPEHVALVLGSEGKGLRRKTRETCDRLARIPLPGRLKSLNVSNAAAIALTINSGLGGS